jgi:DNA helicase-2/ATP-dependent DNA helicase PcrA
LENVRELKSSISNYEENAEEPSLSGFLEEISLYTDIEQYDANADAAVMMTIHSAKGLEFDHVFLVGFEDGLFPGLRSIGDPQEMEEERRLCYVAITRARKTLDITHARQRMLYGRTNAALASRFLREIPERCLLRQGHVQTYSSGIKSSYGQRDNVASSYLSFTAKPKVQTVSVPEYRKGELIEHRMFGKGMILTVQPMGGDALLEIAFDQVGTKKMMAKTASAYMQKLS